MLFKSLVCAVSEQCQEIKQAMALFPYFENWDANIVAECCRVSSLSEFLANEIILGPGVGDSHTVHFLLNGICKMVHHLQIELSTNSRGKLFYKLLALRGSRAPNFEKRTECYLSRMFNQKRVLQDRTNGVAKCLEAPKEEAGGMEVNDDGQGRGKISGSEHEIEVKKEHCERLKAECSPAKSETEMSESEKKIIFESDHHLKLLEECKKRKETTCVQEQSTSPERPANVKSVFIETGTLFMGATFGLGRS